MVEELSHGDDDDDDDDGGGGDDDYDNEDNEDNDGEGHHVTSECDNNISQVLLENKYIQI